MRVYYIGIGREINGPYDGARVASKPRGVWLLHQETWNTLKELTVAVCKRHGEVLFQGEGYGINTVTGEREQGYCIALAPTDGRPVAERLLKAELAALLAAHGQLEFAFSDAIGYTVPTGERS